MTTEAQLAANRENAKRSTGPRTLRGKSRSALNALKHGFRSRIILEESKPFTDESPSPYADFLSDLVDEVQPVGVRESLCVETMAISMWRQRLVIRRELELVLEATPFQREWHKIEEEMYQEDLEDGLNPPPPDLEAHFPNPEKLLPLMRYEAHLDRQYQRAMRQLQQLQSSRFAQERCALHVRSVPQPNEPEDPTFDQSSIISTRDVPVSVQPVRPAQADSSAPNEADRLDLSCRSEAKTDSFSCSMNLPNEANASVDLLGSAEAPAYLAAFSTVPNEPNSTTDDGDASALCAPLLNPGQSTPRQPDRSETASQTLHRAVISKASHSLVPNEPNCRPDEVLCHDDTFLTARPLTMPRRSCFPSSDLHIEPKR